MAPLLTVGSSFYNTAGTIHDLARCVFAQSFTDWEWILVDDGSTDGGGRIARRIRDPRLRVICDGVNKGRSVRYNAITREARGRHIARFDADDLCDPDRFARQVAFLEEHPDVDVVGTDRFSLGPNDVLRGRRREPQHHEDICRKPLRGGIRVCHGGMMGRTSWFEKHPYPENYRIAVDAALLLSGLTASRFANIPEPLYFYREFDTHSLRKYVRTNLAVMRTIWEFGHQAAGRLGVGWALAMRLARMTAYGGGALLGLNRFLIGTRSEAPSDEDVRRFQRATTTIRSTRVPGLDDTEVGDGQEASNG